MPTAATFEEDVTTVYGLTGDVALGLTLPMLQRRLRLDTAAGERRTISADGLGDLALSGAYRFYRRDAARGTTQFSFLGGLKFPTGATDLTDANLTQLTGTPETRLPPKLQLGSGSMDGIVGLAAFQNVDRLSFFADLQGKRKTEGTQDVLTHGGTIFLDEIGELPLELQVKLLRVLQEGEFERVGGADTLKVDVRVIAATNRDLTRAMQEGRFRQDPFCRLHDFPIPLPPLRERRQDIPLLVKYFASMYGKSFGNRIETIPQQTMATLQTYPWPGNVRELEHVIERAVILSQGSRLVPSDWLPQSAAMPHELRLSTLAELERDYIIQVLELTGWWVSGEQGGGKVLGLKPTTLEARMKKPGIQRPK